MIARRWYVALVVLVICAAATSSLVASADTMYSSEATVILLPPSLKQVSDIKADTLTNPFLETGIALTANAIASAANSDRLADQLKAAGLDDVTFSVTGFDQSPILLMSVESSSKDHTIAASEIVVSGVQDITHDLQVEADAPDNQFVTAQVLAPSPGAPVESIAAKTKIAMGMAVASLLVVLCATLLYDRLAVRLADRRRRRDALAEQEGFELFEDDARSGPVAANRRNGEFVAADDDSVDDDVDRRPPAGERAPRPRARAGR